MLETGRVGGVSGDGHVHSLFPHDGNALADVVCAVAPYLCTRTVAVGDLAYDLQFAAVVVELGLHIGEAVDAGYDLCGILAETVKYAAERLLAYFVGLCGNLDGALCGCEGLVAGEEGEALGLLAEEHGGEVAVAETHLAVVSDGTRDAEGLKAYSYGLSCVCGVLAALLDCYGGTYDVGPLCILEAYRLSVFAGLVRIQTVLIADCVCFLDILDTVGVESCEDLLDAAILAFEFHFSYHSSVSFLLVTWVNEFNCTGLGGETAVCSGYLPESLVCIDALLDEVHELAEVYELVAADLVVLVQGKGLDVTLCHLKVARSLRKSSVKGADLAAETLSEVLESGADHKSALGEG